MNEEAEEVLDCAINRTAQALRAMAGEGISPDQALAMLVGAYITRASVHSQVDIAATHALALHRLVANQARIAELEDQVAMLKMLDEIHEL